MKRRRRPHWPDVSGAGPLEIFWGAERFILVHFRKKNSRHLPMEVNFSVWWAASARFRPNIFTIRSAAEAE